MPYIRFVFHSSRTMASFLLVIVNILTTAKPLCSSQLHNHQFCFHCFLHKLCRSWSPFFLCFSAATPFFCFTFISYPLPHVKAVKIFLLLVFSSLHLSNLEAAALICFSICFLLSPAALLPLSYCFLIWAEEACFLSFNSLYF